MAEREEGTRPAGSGESVGSSIRQQISRDLEGQGQQKETVGGMALPKPPSVGKRIWTCLHIRRRELLTFYQELALLLEVGMPLSRSLRGMEARWRHTSLRRVIGTLAVAVEEGRSFSQAMAEQNHVFPNTAISMVRAGEKAGKLDDMLFRIADHAERMATARQRVIGEMVYPLIVLLVAVVVIAVVFGVMGANFDALREIGQAEPPWSLNVMMYMGQAFSTADFWIGAAIVVLAVIVIYQVAKQILAFRKMQDYILIRTPFIRHFLRQGLLARFARIFSTLLDSGVSLQESLQAARYTATNEVLRDSLTGVQEAVRSGRRISEGISKSHVFPAFAVDLCDVGEETGTLGRVFHRMADVYEERQSTEIAMVGKILQPIVVVGLALLVGFIVYAFFSTYIVALQHAPQI